MDLKGRETRIGAYTKIAPHGKIPAIVDPYGPGDKPICVWESGAILLYLAEKYEELIPCHDPALRIETIKWLFWGSTSLNAQIKAFGFYYKYCHHSLPYCQERYAKEVRRLLAVLDNQLATHGKHWVVGGTYHFITHDIKLRFNTYIYTHTHLPT